MAEGAKLDTQDLIQDLVSRLTIGSAVAVLIFVAFLIRAIVDHKGYDSQRASLTEADQLSSAISLSGYLLAIIIGLLESLTITTESLIAQGSEVAIKGLSLIISLELAMFFIDRVWFKGIDVKQQLHIEGNVSLAIARVGALLSMSFMLSAVFEQNAAWHNLVLWYLIGASCIYAVGWIFQRLTPYDDLAEIENANIAAAWPLAGSWLAAGISVQAALIGESVNLVDDLIGVLVFLVLSILLIVLTRFCLRHLFFRGVDLNAEITRDKNIGIGLLEATMYLSIAELVCYFLS